MREIDGAPRKLLLHADPDGYVYALDRATGAVLSAAPFLSRKRERRRSTRPRAPCACAASASPRQDVTQRDLCPGWPGALGAPPTLSPDGKLLLIPASRLCMDMEARNVSYIKGTAFVGADLRLKNPPDGDGGALIAWDIGADKPAWTLRERFPVASSPLVTGDFALYGTLEGELKAVDLASGRALGHRRLASGIVSPPVALRDADGRDLIAVLAGTGGRFGRTAERDIDMRDATAAHGLGNLRPPPPEPDDSSGRLYLFAP